MNDKKEDLEKEFVEVPQSLMNDSENNITNNRGILSLYKTLKENGYECLYSKHEDAITKGKFEPRIMEQWWDVTVPIPEEQVLDVVNKRERRMKDYVLVVADTHDDVVGMDYVIRKANTLGIRTMVHGGDIVHNGMLSVLAGFRGSIYGALGNHDRFVAVHYVHEHPRTDLKWTTNVFGVQGQRFVVNHGEDISFLEQLTTYNATDEPTFIVYGHWHSPCFYYNRELRRCVINPGMFTTVEPVFLLLNTKDPEASVYVKIRQRKGPVIREEEEGEGGESSAVTPPS